MEQLGQNHYTKQVLQLIFLLVLWTKAFDADKYCADKYRVALWYNVIVFSKPEAIHVDAHKIRMHMLFTYVTVFVSNLKRKSTWMHSSDWANNI